jgi:outer membrane protein OmpA-like peptidoglycan-associated protein
MKKYLLLLPLLTFIIATHAQEGIYVRDTTLPRNCFDDYYEEFTTRGSLPVPDGEHNVVFSARKEKECTCGEGKIVVKYGNIIPGLLVKKSDGTYQPAKKTLHPKTNTGEGENPAKFTVFSGMSASFLTDDYYIVNLFFVDYLKLKVLDNAAAPSPKDISGVQVELTPLEKEVVRKAYEELSFETGKSDIKSTSYSHLNLLATMMQEKPDYKLNLNGYTDNVGKAESNLLLSQKRADAVKDYLIEQSIGANRIIAKGFGMENPIADNATPAGRAKNRRVDFIMVK